MTASVYVVGNFKGGVGKTKTVTMLAYEASTLKNRKTLVIDLDPQDVPPTISDFSDNAMFAADYCIVILQTQELSLDGAQTYIEYMQYLIDNYDININVLGILPCMLRPNGRVDEKILNDAREKYGNNVLTTIVNHQERLKAYDSEDYDIKTIGKGSNDDHTYISDGDVNHIFNTNVKKYDDERKQQEKSEKANEKKEADNEAKKQSKNLIEGMFGTNNIKPDDFVGGKKNESYKELKDLIPDNGVKVDNSVKNVSSSDEVHSDTKMESIKKSSKNEYILNYLVTIENKKNKLDTNEMSSKTTKNTKKIKYEAKIKNTDKDQFKIVSNKQIKVLSDKTEEE
ncbi:GRIP and coiled-coil domain-containing protein-like [Polyergus mexicanus]|uniref:GRIP and coiled-coil domain-containing protein-like n=1 Tax=Polyergus mexicanus TaxID=615972 RepID=UPI0038B43040